MIRRALLIVASALALSAAGAMAFTPAAARAGRSWTRGIRTAFGITPVPRLAGGAHATDGLLQHDDEVAGAFCPIRPPADEAAALVPDSVGAQMSTDPRARAPIDSSTLAPGESLLTLPPALCRPGSATQPMQSGNGR